MPAQKSNTFFFFVSATPSSQMSAAAFPSPAAEMAEMNRLQYELDYTEGISQRMRIPEMLKVAPHTREDPATASIMVSQDVHHSVIMQVPERIVVAGQSIPSVDRCIKILLEKMLLSCHKLPFHDP